MDTLRELVVVNFAGGGGSDTGIEAALRYPVDHAINHDPVALGMYRRNHPFTDIHCEDVFRVNPSRLADGRKVGLGWFSPDCTFHSKAKGGKPVESRRRALAVIMLKWAKIGTRVMIMENVEEIIHWGPLVEITKNGTPGLYPDPKHRGRTWQAFLACLGSGIAPDHPDLPEILETLEGSVTEEECVRGFGYVHEARELKAYHYNTPTLRKRLYMVCRNDGRPIVWPDPTHDRPGFVSETRKPWRTIAQCIDWHETMHSIFLEGEAAKKAKCKRPLVRATKKRIASGVDRFMLRSANPFVVSLTHQGGDRTEDINEPIRTLTCAHRGEKALVSAMITEHAQSSNQRNMSVDEPMRTLCAGVKGGHFAVTTAHMVKLRGTNVGSPADTPVGTITAGGTHHGLISGLLVRQFGNSEGADMAAPAPTVMPGGQGKTALLAACMAQHNGGHNAVPARTVEEPVSTLGTTCSQQQIVTASIVAYYGTERDGQPADVPARTTRTKGHLGLVTSNAAMEAGLTEEEHQGALRVAAFLREFGVEVPGLYALVAGFVIYDLCMRMLTPKESFRAMGFPETYIIDNASIHYPDRIVNRKLTKTEQQRLCGNAVCPPVAKALVEANVPEMIDHTMPPMWPGV